MKIRKGRSSGKVGNEVYVNSKYGQVVRSRPRRPTRATAARVRVWGNMSSVTSTWRRRTHKQFVAWTIASQEVSSQLPEGTPSPRDGYHLFCKINFARAAAGLPVIMDPPKRERFRRNPVEELDITNRDDVITLRLRVPEAPAKHTFVLGSPPCSPGKSVRSNYSTLGPLPPAERGWCNITDMYVNKFGRPPVGSRVFIRTRQLINGWEDDFKDTDAVVPPG